MTNNGKYHESHYEEAFLQKLSAVGYSRMAGAAMTRSSEREVLYMNDLAQFITRSNSALTPRDVVQAADRVRMAGGDDDFAALHSIYALMVYDKEGREIVCRYPQFFADRLLKESIVKSITERSKRRDEQDRDKGGTYFGATGCGKTYTMMFLARQLALRCTGEAGMGYPTHLKLPFTIV